ncbi:hypothetical protein Tco_0117417 [Tanacetum coccineum]
MESANPSCSTSNREFLNPKKKKEIDSWLGDSRIIDSFDGLNEIEYFDTFPTLKELEYHEQILKYPKPSWLKAKIRTKNLNNIKISCKIAMIHMPKGAKVLKDLLSHKEKLEKVASSVKLSEECSTIIQRSLPQKEGDPGSFTLPCLIGPLAEFNIEIRDKKGAENLAADISPTQIPRLGKLTRA